MKTAFYLLVAVASLQGCAAQNNDPKVALPKEYEACCGVQPVDFKLSNGFIYVPNVFTPNGDGINDLFYPFISPEIGEVQGFTVFSAEGDTVLFQRQTIIYSEIEKWAWNGYRNNGSTFSTRYKGRFKYGMRVVSKDRILRYVEGEACSVLCEPGTSELKVKKGCFFPSQAGKNDKLGKSDSTLANSEKDCLK